MMKLTLGWWCSFNIGKQGGKDIKSNEEETLRKNMTLPILPLGSSSFARAKMKDQKNGGC